MDDKDITDMVAGEAGKPKRGASAPSRFTWDQERQRYVPKPDRYPRSPTNPIETPNEPVRRPDGTYVTPEGYVLTEDEYQDYILEAEELEAELLDEELAQGALWDDEELECADHEFEFGVVHQGRDVIGSVAECVHCGMVLDGRQIEALLKAATTLRPNELERAARASGGQATVTGMMLIKAAHWLRIADESTNRSPEQAHAESAGEGDRK